MKPKDKQRVKPVKLDFRAQTHYFDSDDTLDEWKRLGIETKNLDTVSSQAFMFEMVKGYKKEFGKLAIGQDKGENPGMVITEPSAMHLAAIEHKDEEVFRIVVKGGFEMPSPYLCYLVTEGWVKFKDDAWGDFETALIEVGDKIWRKACVKALRSQKREKVFLNPRGTYILTNALAEYILLTRQGKKWETNNKPYEVIKNISNQNYPIGPGFENFVESLIKWLAQKKPEELKILLEGTGGGLSDLSLEHTPIADTPKGLSVLLDFIDKNYMDDGKAIELLLKNQSITKESRGLLLEWAIKKALEWPQEGSNGARNIFCTWAKEGGQLSSNQKARLLLGMGVRLEPSLNPEESDWRDYELQTLAMVPWVSQEPELRTKLLAKNDSSIMVEMLYHSKGKDWLSLAETILFSDVGYEEEALIEAFKYADASSVLGLKRKDLAKLLKDDNREIRAQVIRLATLITNPSLGVK